MSGFGESVIPQMREQQHAELGRRQSAWEDTYNDMRAIPPEVYADEKFAPLTQAAEALEVDMKDGKIDDEKGYTNFLKLSKEFKGDIAEHMKGIELANQAAEARNKWETGQTILAVEEEKLNQQLLDPMITPEQKEQIKWRIKALYGEAANLQMRSETLAAQQAAREQSQANADRSYEQSEERLGLQRRGVESSEKLTDIRLGQDESRRSASEVVSMLAQQVESTQRQATSAAGPYGSQSPGSVNEDQLMIQTIMSSEANMKALGEAVGATLIPDQKAIVWQGQTYDLSDPNVRDQVVRQMYSKLQAAARFGAQQ
jgi:hypothetical protein